MKKFDVYGSPSQYLIREFEFESFNFKHEEFSSGEERREREKEREIKMSFFDFKSKTIWGNTVNFESFSEKVVMLINVASQ